MGFRPCLLMEWLPPPCHPEDRGHGRVTPRLPGSPLLGRLSCWWLTWFPFLFEPASSATSGLCPGVLLGLPLLSQRGTDGLCPGKGWGGGATLQPSRQELRGSPVAWLQWPRPPVLLVSVRDEGVAWSLALGDECPCPFHGHHSSWPAGGGLAGPHLRATRFCGAQAPGAARPLSSLLWAGLRGSPGSLLGRARSPGSTARPPGSTSVLAPGGSAVRGAERRQPPPPGHRAAGQQGQSPPRPQREAALLPTEPQPWPAKTPGVATLTPSSTGVSNPVRGVACHRPALCPPLLDRRGDPVTSLPRFRGPRAS